MLRISDRATLAPWLLIDGMSKVRHSVVGPEILMVLAVPVACVFAGFFPASILARYFHGIRPAAGGLRWRLWVAAVLWLGWFKAQNLHGLSNFLVGD